MKSYYVDSSVVVAMLLEEEGAEKYRKITGEADQLLSSYLLEAEVYCAASREEVPLNLAEDFLKHLSLVSSERSLSSEYRRILAQGYCRGSDACHLATFLYLDPQGTELELLTADKRQAEIARLLGIRSKSF